MSQRHFNYPVVSLGNWVPSWLGFGTNTKRLRLGKVQTLDQNNIHVHSGHL